MKKILACATLSILLLTGCNFNRSGIIQVNDTIITKAEFDKKLDRKLNEHPILKNFGGAKNFSKTDENPAYIEIKNFVVRELIYDSLIKEEIKKRGITVTDEDYKEELKKTVDRIGSIDELNKILKDRGIKNNQFTEDLKTQIKMKKLIDSISNIKISDSDAEKYYKNNIERFKYPEKVRVSHIFVEANVLNTIKEQKAKNKNISTLELNKKVDDILNAKKNKADEILKEVLAKPENFEKIATSKSEDNASAERGGELGYITKDFLPEISKVAFSTKPDTIHKDLIVSNYGYHILKVSDKTEAGVTPFAKVKDEIKYYLEVQEQVKSLKNFTDGLMKTADIKYIDETFKPKNTIKVEVNEEK